MFPQVEAPDFRRGTGAEQSRSGLAGLYWREMRLALTAAGRKGLDAMGFPWAGRWPEITDIRVRQAFHTVTRANFVPPSVRRYAERDAPLPIGEEQTISQPFVVALMTQALQLQPRDRVLEIGTGSGFQTAILCELTEPDSRPAEPHQPKGESVYSIERIASLSRRAAQTLNQEGYSPQLRIGDGAAGWPDVAPFDAVIVTAAPAWLPRPLWDQLKEGGRIVVPVGPESDQQILWHVRKVGGAPVAQSLGPVRFVPLRSQLLADPMARMSLDQS